MKTDPKARDIGITTHFELDPSGFKKISFFTFNERLRSKQQTGGKGGFQERFVLGSPHKQEGA